MHLLISLHVKKEGGKGEIKEKREGTLSINESTCEKLDCGALMMETCHV